MAIHPSYHSRNRTAYIWIPLHVHCGLVHMFGEGKYVPCCPYSCAMIFPHSQVAIDGEDGGEDEDIYCRKQWEKRKIILYERAGFTF